MKIKNFFFVFEFEIFQSYFLSFTTLFCESLNRSSQKHLFLLLLNSKFKIQMIQIHSNEPVIQTCNYAFLSTTLSINSGVKRGAELCLLYLLNYNFNMNTLHSSRPLSTDTFYVEEGNLLF